MEIATTIPNLMRFKSSLSRSGAVSFSATYEKKNFLSIMNNASFVVFAATALFCAFAVGAHEGLCGENEARYHCGRLCEERCNAAPPGFCRALRCDRSACRCKTNFARDPSTNRCIPKATCPINKCAYGEVEAPCGQRCEGTCGRPWVPDMCRKIRCSDWACRCDSAGGYVRNRHGICVHRGQC